MNLNTLILDSAILSPKDGGSFSAASGRTYAVSIVRQTNQQGITFTANGTGGLPSGQSEDFIFTIKEASLLTSSRFLNNAVSTAGENARWITPIGSCLILPARVLEANACSSGENQNNRMAKLSWKATAPDSLYHVDKVAADGTVRLTAQPLAQGANGSLSFIEQESREEAISYRILPVLPAEEVDGPPVEVALQTTCSDTQFVSQGTRGWTSLLAVFLTICGALLLRQRQHQKVT